MAPNSGVDCSADSTNLMSLVCFKICLDAKSSKEKATQKLKDFLFEGDVEGLYTVKTTVDFTIYLLLEHNGGRGSLNVSRKVKVNLALCTKCTTLDKMLIFVYEISFDII